MLCTEKVSFDIGFYRSYKTEWNNSKVVCRQVVDYMCNQAGDKGVVCKPEKYSGSSDASYFDHVCN